MKMRPLTFAVSLAVVLLLLGLPLNAQNSAPTGLTATIGNGVTLTWQAPSGNVLDYLIEAGSGPGRADIATFLAGNIATTLRVGSVPPGYYVVRVRAVTATGVTGPSNEVTVSILSAQCPSFSSGFVPIVRGNQVSFFWSGLATATSYVLEVGSASGLTDLFNVDVGPVTTVTAAGAPGTYYTRLRARTPCGLSAPSTEQLVKIQTLQPSLYLTFANVGDNNTPISTYTETGFTVEAINGGWYAARTFGNAAPSIQFKNPGTGAMSGQLRITRNGATFRFLGVDVYSSITPIPYIIEGIRDSGVVYQVSGTVGMTLGRFATIPGVAETPVDAILITLTNPTVCCAGNPIGIDNVALTF